MFSRTNEMILKLLAHYRDEEGQALAEYGLILGLIAVVAIAALTLVLIQYAVYIEDLRY